MLGFGFLFSFFFFQTKNGVMLTIDPPVLFCFLPNAHLNGVMGCVFFFGSFWGWPLVNKPVSDVSHPLH